MKRSFVLGSLWLVGIANAVPATSKSTEIPSEAYVQVETDPTKVKWPWRVFKSSPYTPPNMTITGNGGELAEGFIFMTPQTTNMTNPTDEENGGFIMTSDGDLVYALNESGITDFRKQYYDGKPYLTYWSGFVSLKTGRTLSTRTTY